MTGRVEEQIGAVRRITVTYENGQKEIHELVGGLKVRTEYK